VLAEVSFELLNGWQRGFPLVPRPFAEIGARLGMTEEAVIAACRRGLEEGAISRIGVVFAPRAAGASTLAALRAPPEALERIAGLVSAQPEVNHNYEREHALNLWFVATAPDQAALDSALARIASLTRCEVLPLPMVEEFHIDLGFDLRTGVAPRAVARTPGGALDADDRRLVKAVQGGLELVPRPFDALAARAGSSEVDVLARLGRWLEDGVARRIGIVVRHDSQGYRANAMAVWDVPDAGVSQAGARLARHDEVTLCYRRERRPPQWPYNLFCMIHGRDRGSVEQALARIAGEAALEAFPSAVLFSGRCFKQRGARYA